MPCKLIDSYFAPDLLERTNCQLRLVVSSFPELGLAGIDALKLIDDGTFEMAVVYGGYVSDDLPELQFRDLVGL